MASCRASQSVQKLNKYRYKKYVQALNERDALTMDEFKETKWSSYFAVDLTRIYKNGKANPNHVFELFGSFDNKSAAVVRQNLLQNVATEIDFYEQRSVVCLAMRSIGLDTWVTNMDNDKMYCDELGLMGLSKLYGRHSVVLTKSKLWSTIDADAPFNLLELLQQCSVWFVFLGHLRFASLVWKPRIPVPPTPKLPAPSFEIIEEYTLDEDELSASASKGNPSTDLEKSDRNRHIVPAHVGTIAIAKQSELTAVTSINPDKAGQTKTDTAARNILDTSSRTISEPHAENAESADKNIPVETSSKEHTTTQDDVLPSQYPWTKSTSICLERINPLEIDIWTDSVHNYWCSDVGTATKDSEAPNKPTVTAHVPRNKVKPEPIQVVVKREIASPPPPPDTKTEDLIKRAESLIQRAKELGTDKPRKRRCTETLNVETDAPPTPSDRKIKCKLCKRKFNTEEELEEHHSGDHGIAKCDLCGKCFDTKKALSKHMDTHTDSRWVCDECGKGFEYESRLLQHQRVHDNEARLYCPYKTCDRSFKNVGDYNRHTKTHSAGGWYTCSICPYKNKDKRNRDSHVRVHTKKGDKERYECGRCHKQMRFSMQVRRHNEAGCDPKML